MSSGGKATFVGIDGPSFTVQYNPREFSTNKTLSWSEAKTAGGDPAKLQYQQGAPMTASMELIFDSTSSGGDVESAYVQPLLELTKPTIPAKSGQAKDLGTLRPPAFMFNWGTFSMPCVIESVDVTYLMFSASGDPVRAKCSVKLKEWTGDQSGSSAGGAAAAVGSAASAVSSLVQVQGGQTLSQVAAANNTTAQAIAALNNISDPMADLTGTSVAIPR
jgi:LysM repeat protein